MSGRPLPIVELARAGVVDMVRAVRAMPGPFAALALLSAAAAWLDWAAPALFGWPSAVEVVLSLATSSLVSAGVAVLMHRFVILSERNTLASLASRWRVALDFATVLFGAQFLAFLPGVLALSIFGRQEDMPGWAVPFAVAVAVLGGAALLAHLMVFPAIAIEARDRSLRTALAGAARVVLPIVIAAILAMLFMSLVGSLVALPLLLAAGDALFLAAAFVIVAEVAISAATVAIVSRAYLWREGRWPEEEI